MMKSLSEKQKKGLFRILLAAAFFAAALILSHAGVPFFSHRPVRFIAFLIPYLICGAPVLAKALHGVRNRRMFDESFLMTLASVGAFATGEYAEAAAVMLFYQIGEWFQSYAVGRSRQSIADLMEIAPEYAEIEREDGAERCDPDEVEPGDVLIIRPGEKIPVDAEVISGESSVQTAALTGEALPRGVKAGDQVLSGCVNGEGLLRVRALKAYEDSTVARILEMVENASERKSRTESFITRFARYYTPAVVIAAAALAVLPSLVTGNWGQWIYRACTFLVISCPCALVISVPLAFFGGIGASSRQGVLVKGAGDLEQLARLTTVVTDKTGTLTKGEFAVTELLPAAGVPRGELLETAALAEGATTHPIGVSIREAYAAEAAGGSVSAKEAADGRNLPGLGVSAQVDGKRVLVGGRRLLESEGVRVPEADRPGAVVCHVSADGRYLGAIVIRDELKEGAAEALRALRDGGVRKIVLLTGDAAANAEAVARELGIDRVVSGLLPQDKVAELEKILASEGDGTTAFIGDGINDAPVLMRADIGIAMGALGSDAAIEAADAVVMDDDPRRIAPVVRTARKTVAIARENIVFALGVKFLILILGAAGLANMWAAVFADVGVAMLCILNAMRLVMQGKQ